MFSQQHYEAIAKVLRETRIEISREDVTPDGKQVDPILHGAKMDAIGALQLKLHTLFKKDNPKFKELLFIGVASEHAPAKHPAR